MKKGEKSGSATRPLRQSLQLRQSQARLAIARANRSCLRTASTESRVGQVVSRAERCQTFGCLGHRKLDLRLESSRICVIDELVFYLPEKKLMSIYDGLSFLAIVSPGNCPQLPIHG
jgi:hypothetical protein